ncbi:ABC transporter substrate-binding protein [Desulfobacterales bacterium HSG17]|nr:ABC transporter substrate-binding protein [Desulfobacterales bacterium HSG17]
MSYRIMKRIVSLLPAIILLFAMNSFSSEVTIDDFRLLTEEYPPFNFKRNNFLQGISVDMMEEILKKVDANTTREDIELLPWARAYRDVLREKNTCLFAMTRTKEREALFKWVGPFATLKIVLTAPKYRRIIIKSIEDINKYIVGVVRDDVGEQILVQNGIIKGTLSIVHHPDINAKKLVAGRIDLWAYADITARWILRENGYDSNEYESVYVLKEGQLYFALNAKTPDYLIQKLQQALDDLKTEGLHQKILDKY